MQRATGLISTHTCAGSNCCHPAMWPVVASGSLWHAKTAGPTPAVLQGLLARGSAEHIPAAATVAAKCHRRVAAAEGLLLATTAQPGVTAAKHTYGHMSALTTCSRPVAAPCNLPTTPLGSQGRSGSRGSHHASTLLRACSSCRWREGGGDGSRCQHKTTYTTHSGRHCGVCATPVWRAATSGHPS